MKLNFVKLSPTRNMTIIVTDAVPRSLQGTVAEQLMAYGNVGAEQVGFLEEPSLPGARARLQMMGGEFCGNASMSMAAYLAYTDGLPDGAHTEVPLEVSGADELVRCEIERWGDGYRGSVRMPLPESIEEFSFGPGCSYPLVSFPGIAHAIVPDTRMTPAEAEACIAAWCRQCGAEALGIVLTSEGCDSFRPLVYVRETGSCVWEHGCGSGTAAIGAHFASCRRAGSTLDLSQPGGVMRIQARYDGSLTELRITGSVKIAAIGQAWIDLEQP